MFSFFGAIKINLIFFCIETIESYFVLHWITGDPIYQQWAWEAFTAIEKNCKVPNGYLNTFMSFCLLPVIHSLKSIRYSGIEDVTAPKANIVHDDLQQSFFMAETLKYLYLLFSPEGTLPIDEWVFNTEAHPLRVWKK